MVLWQPGSLVETTFVHFFSSPNWLPSVGVKKGTIRGEAGVT